MMINIYSKNCIQTVDRIATYTYGVSWEGLNSSSDFKWNMKLFDCSFTIGHRQHLRLIELLPCGGERLFEHRGRLTALSGSKPVAVGLKLCAVCQSLKRHLKAGFVSGAGIRVNSYFTVSDLSGMRSCCSLPRAACKGEGCHCRFGV